MQNMRFKLYQRWLTHVIFLGLVLVKPVSADGEIGYVDAIDCDEKNDYGHISLFEKNKQQPIKIAPGMPLYAGDMIKFKSRKICQIHLKFGLCDLTITNGRTLWRDKKRCSGILVKKDFDKNEYVITGNYSPPSIWEDGGKVLSNWFASAFKRQILGIGTIIRSGDPSGENSYFQLETGLLSNQTQMEWVEGKRQLYLAWFGGKPPFTVIVNLEKTVIFEKTVGEKNSSKENSKESSNIHKITLDSFNYLLGNSYLIQIKDATDKTVEGEIKIVSKKPMPPVAAGLPSHLQAFWLASKDEKWKLEAYQDVANQTPDSSKKFNAAGVVEVGLVGGISLLNPERN